jgi:hypothetical protein
MSASAQVADISITVTSSNGAVAPRFYEVRRITVRNSGDGEIQVTTGTEGSGKKDWKSAFVADPAKLRALMDYIRSNHLDAPPLPAGVTPPPPARPGDGTCNLLVVSSGNRYGLPCSGRAAALPQMMRDIVPGSIAPERSTP